MHSPEHCFTRFTADISGYELQRSLRFRSTTRRILFALWPQSNCNSTY